MADILQLPKVWNRFIDSHGLVVHGTGDGGDTLANQCTLYYVNAATGMPLPPRTLEPAFISLFFVNGIPVRHPWAPFGWENTTNRTSRDQIIPLLCYMCTTDSIRPKNGFISFFKAYLAHLCLFAWNTLGNGPGAVIHKVPDVLGPQVLALWVRYWRAWFLYPVLCVLDLYTLINVLLNLYQFRKGTADPDQRNLGLVAHCNVEIMPTPISMISKALYGCKLPAWSANKFWASDANEPPIDTYWLKLFQ